MNNGIVIDNISKSFGDIQVLRNVRASIPEGKITAFIGPNGAGKSTLFHVITGTLKPDEGTVTYKNRNITGLPAYAVARLGIGRQFQDVRVFGGLTAFENILVGMIPCEDQNIWSPWIGATLKKDYKKHLAPNVMRWLEYVGLEDHRYHLARDLSFGQQKLLALARLFAKGFEFLLFDEPTSGLSHHMIDTITDLIGRAVSDFGATIALIEHNMSVVTNLSYWIHFLHEGQVAFSGKSEHVIGNRSVREIYMGI